MGRFNTLEFESSPEVCESPARPAGAGEALKDAQYFLDQADRSFYRMEYEPALQSYSRAAGIDPGAQAAWSGQVMTLIELEEYEEAILWIGKAMEVAGESADLLALRAWAAARTGDFDRACGYSDASLEAAGGGALPFIVRGELFLYGRRNGELVFEQACTFDASWKTRVKIADSCLFSAKRKSAMIALKYLHPALELQPNRPELYLRLALIRHALGDRNAALDALEQAQVLDRNLQAISSLQQTVQTRSWWRRMLGI